MFLALIAVAFPAPASAQFVSVRIQIVDVGQGDGILIRTPRQRWVLIDAGPNQMLADSLGPQFGVDRLALVVVSHRHGDHYAGIERVLRTLAVDRFIGNLADCPINVTDDHIRQALQDRNVPAQSIGADTLDVDSVRFIIFPPDPVDDPCPGDENDNSILVRLEFGQFSMLFTGDAEAEERDSVILANPDLVDVDVLKAAHHGSNNGLSPNWLRAVTPQIVVISAGVRADYKHPMTAAVQAYDSVTEGRVYCTNRHGTIRIYGYADGHATIRTQRQPTKGCAYDGTHY